MFVSVKYFFYFLGLANRQASGEATMYPKPEADLSGWSIRQIAAGCVWLPLMRVTRLYLECGPCINCPISMCMCFATYK
jgi:hypothetical protein